MRIPHAFAINNDTGLYVVDTPNPEARWVLENRGLAFRWHDGLQAKIIHGEIYEPFDMNLTPREISRLRAGKLPIDEGWKPEGEIDPVTGLWQGWKHIPLSATRELYVRAYIYGARYGDLGQPPPDGYYSVVGKGVKGNRYRLRYVTLYPWTHRITALQDVSYDNIHEWLVEHVDEYGVLFKYRSRFAKVERQYMNLSWVGRASA